MSDYELIDAVAKKTGESVREIRRRGFMLTGPEESGADLDPECRLDLVDLLETRTVAWDSLGVRCREPFLTSTLMARQKSRAKASVKTGQKKQLAQPDDTNWTGAEIKSCCRFASLLDVPLIQTAQNVVPVAVTAR